MGRQNPVQGKPQPLQPNHHPILQKNDPSQAHFSLPQVNTSQHMKTNVLSTPNALTGCLLGILVLANQGCQVATSLQPIGSQPAAVSELHLDGVWHAADGQPVFIRTQDAAAGKLEAAQISTQTSGFVLERQEILLRQHNNTLFANIREIAPQPDTGYVFGRLTVTDHVLILTLAASKPLRSLALQGELAASITTNTSQGETTYSVIVTNGFDSLATRLARPEGWQWLDTANPVVLTRQR